MSTKDKIKLFIIRDGVDAIIGIAIVLIVGISGLVSGEITKKSLTTIIPIVIAAAAWYVARVFNRKNGMVQQQKEMHEKLLYNVKHDLETGHYDAELRYKQLKAYLQSMIITDDEYREIKAKYDEDQKNRE